ncbi:MAG: D-mannonate epimerase, partial [Bacteroidales bacterium]|nr:D-mannonate epimerase [Bacteroidales bacterium]
MLYFARGSSTGDISPEEIRTILGEVFDRMGPKHRVLAIPPDFTRLNSFAGPITEMCNDYFGDALTDVMP